MDRVGHRTLLVAALLLASLSMTGLVAAGANATVTGGNATTVPANGSAAEPPDTRASLPGIQADSGESILLTQELRLTQDRPGQIDVQYRLLIPDRVTDVRLRVPPDARNVRSVRFTRVEGNIYAWPGETSTASITVTLPANETVARAGPETTDGRLRFVDVGEWALLKRPPVASPGYTYREDDPGVTVRNVTAGPGVVGKGLVYLGPHETYERSAHGQRFRLVVPEAATLAEDRQAIFDSVTAAADRLRVGDRDGQVLMIAAPASVPWGQRGLTVGPRGFYVLADEPVDEPDNTWVHEYVHTRQDFESTGQTEWLFEAMAEYYAGQLTLEQDRTDYSSFREYLGRGTTRRLSSVRLTEKSTWVGNLGDYLKGALVVGELDRRVRLATDSQATFQDVFRRLNRHPDAVTHAEFIEFVRAAGGGAVVDPARRYTETTARPETWSAKAHQEAFGKLPPVFRYRLPDRGSDGLRVTSRYREGTLGSATLVTGETLEFDVTVENVGGAAGTYDLAVTVDGANVASRSGRLGPGESTTETVEYTFVEPGRHTFSTGEDSTTFEVREPATPAVTDLSVDSERIQAGGDVTVTATLKNPTDRPGKRTLTIRRDGSEVTSEEIELPAGTSTEVSARVTLGEAGTYRFTAGDRAVTVTVTEVETATDTRTGTSTDSEGGSDGDGGTADDGSLGDVDIGVGVSGPGFGPLAALVALAALVSFFLAERVE